jgi:ABC-2 type transport system permease protein
METLIVSARPSRILVGKVLAMGTAGFIQFALIMAWGNVCASLFITPEAAETFSFSLRALTPGASAWLAVYFILGYLLYAVMSSVCGAMISRIEDVNAALMPIFGLAMASFYAGFFPLVLSRNETLHRIVLHIPFTAPFSAPFQLLNSDVPTRDICVSLLLLAAAICFFTFAAARVYTASVLHYGVRLRFRDLRRLSRDKD